MEICWYCYWGWPQPVADIYDKALEMLDGDDSVLDYGPGHIVWADENFHSAEWCLEHFNEYRGDYMEDELKIARWALEELVKIPLEIRDPEPDDYDNEHPEKYPPPEHIEFIK